MNSMQEERVIPVGVVGAGQFGRQHMRVIATTPGAELRAVYDIDRARSEQAVRDYGGEVAEDLEELAGKVQAAVVTVPTVAHAEVSCRLLELGVDVLVEKPIANTLAGAQQIVATATKWGRVLQVGHLERFNPAVEAVERILTVPLFFEIHRLSPFTARSLDVDVVLDLMIHDLDIVLAFTQQQPASVHAAGISILSPRVDIANVRLEFASGCVANLTASRVSTERIRKLRFFQPHQYVSIDYSRQDVQVYSVNEDRTIRREQLEVNKCEPLRRQFEHFLDCVRSRSRPRVSGESAMAALKAGLEVLDKIEDHGRRVRKTLGRLHEA